MDGAARAKLGAALLFVLCLFGLAVWVADWYVGWAYRHVVVEVSNVTGIARIDVDCRRADSPEAGEVPKRVDLGWLAPQNLVYLSEYNERGAAAWGFKVVSNGEVVRNFSNGHAGVTGEATGPYLVAMAQLISADGDRVGTIGCAQPALVSGSVADYQQAPEMRAMKREKALPPWEAPTVPYAAIEALVDWLPLLALVGWVVAGAIAGVREAIRRHRGVSIAIGLLNLLLALSKSVGPEALLVWFTGVGLVLLLVSALVTAWPHTEPCCLSSCSTPEPKPNAE